MDFKIGYSVKPKEVNNQNEVIFEEFAIGGEIGELVDVLPTADECKAYGFIFKSSDSRCYVKDEAAFINPPSPRDNLIVARANNNIGGNTRDNIISGIEHTLTGNNYSNIISGDNHTLTDLVSNSKVSGTKGEATADNSIVLGGNAPDDNLAERQTTTLMYGLQTTDGNTKASYLNNITANFFTIPDNTAMYFHADVLAVRVGGTGTGNIGDFLSWVERGVVINKSGVLSIQRERDTIKGFGNHTTWRPTGAVSGTNFVMNVRGAANTIIEWASTIKFTEIRTGVAL